MNTSESLRNLVGRTAVCAALIAGFAGAAVVASASASAAVPAHQSAQISNDTPYAMTLTSDIPDGREGGGCRQSNSQLTAPNTIAPGQTVTFDMDYQDCPYTWWYDYSVPGAPDGQQHQTLFAGSQWDGLTTFAQAVGTGFGGTSASTIAHIANDPDGNANHRDLLMNSPVTVAMDNSKDPASAAQVMNYQFPRANKDSITFTPADPNAEPTFKRGPATRASSVVINDSSSDVTLSSGFDASLGQSTSVGVEVSGSIQVKVAGTSGKVAASVEADYDWGSSDSTEVETDTDIKPQMEGYLTTQLTKATIFGDLQFTTPEGVTFDITNIAVSQGDVPNPKGTDGTQIGLAYSNCEYPTTGTVQGDPGADCSQTAPHAA